MGGSAKVHHKVGVGFGYLGVEGPVFQEKVQTALISISFRNLSSMFALLIRYFC